MMGASSHAGVGARVAAAAWVTGVLTASVAGASGKVLKHDKFPDDISSAAAAMTGQTLQVEPGFVQGEAYGAIFRPALVDYPFTVDGVDLVFAGPQDSSFADTTDLSVEIYLDSGTGPAPANPTPDFTIASSEFYNPSTGAFGVPIKGNSAYQFSFDPQDPEGAPPTVTQGNIMVVVRFTKPTKDYSSDGWGIFECFKALPLVCGCQPVGMILDGTPTSKNLTPQANVMHLVWPLGQCSGDKAWKYFEDIAAGGKALNGDVVVRLRINSSDSGCVGSCDGKECGDDGCGNPCGTCAGGESCTSSGTCCAKQCEGKVCGADGCGGVCGNCAAGLACDAGLCKQPCTPNCANRECGPDGCGGTCGTSECTAGTTCDGITGLCVSACTPDCAGRECGNDGCGGSCGTCGDNELCTNEYKCAAVSGCTPACEGKTCGSDGCGGSCGSCAEGETCNATGTCDPAATDGTDATDAADGADATDGSTGGALAVDTISPDEGEEGKPTAVTITGEGFADGISVKLGGTSLEDVVVESPKIISASVPKTLAAGTYDLILFDKAGGTATLRNAFTVQAGAAAASGCAASSTGQGAVGIALLLGVGLALPLLRRRRQVPARIRRRPATPRRD